jgi:hypothetical protein
MTADDSKSAASFARPGRAVIDRRYRKTAHQLRTPKKRVACLPIGAKAACFHLPTFSSGTTLKSPLRMQISSLLKPEQIKLELTQQKRCNAINEVAQLLQGNPSVVNFPGL